MRSAHKSLPELKEQLETLQIERERVVSEFLLTDVKTSLTFAQEALRKSNSAEKRERNRRSARRGYDAVVHFSEKTVMPKPYRLEFEEKLRELRALLRKVGEKF